MGKYRDQVDQRRDFLMKSQKAFEQAQRQLRRECMHQRTKDGETKLTLENLGGGMFRCKRCGDEFSMADIPKSELITARTILHNAIQTVRALSNIKDEQDREICFDLGQVDSSLDNVLRLYDRTMDLYKNKRNRKNRGRKNKGGDRFGGYNSLNNSIGNRY